MSLTSSDAYFAAFELQALMERTCLLRYVQDMRDLLGNHTATDGEQYQAYRNRWSHLCRQLCDERGRAVLTDVDGGKINWPKYVSPFAGL